MPLIPVVLCICALPAHASLPAFFDEIYQESLPTYASLKEESYHSFCSTYNLASTHETNRSTYLRICFLHELLTGSGASNCTRGGMLRTPYFWHWVTPNPRHRILSLPDSVLLVSVSPPPAYGQYQTCADIDRVPALYFSDLVSESPHYAHSDCGAFFTFGWCSEREMAYVALLGALGYHGKVVQSDIHTWSVLWCPLIGAEGNDAVLEARVDNTFDSISWEFVDPSATLETWLTDVGSGSTIDWYNRMAHSADQRAQLEMIDVGPAARNRIRQLVRSGMRSRGR